jgi:hypothetical protein
MSLKVTLKKYAVTFKEIHKGQKKGYWRVSSHEMNNIQDPQNVWSLLTILAIFSQVHK